MKHLIMRIYEKETYKKVLVDKSVPGWFYSNLDSDYSDWKLIELTELDKDIVTEKIMRFEKENLLKMPTDFLEFILSFWKEELTINQEDVDYYLFRNLPGKELDEYKQALKDYADFGTMTHSIPFGQDEFGNWILIKCKDGSVWVEDTDFNKNIRLSSSLSEFLAGNIKRFAE